MITFFLFLLITVAFVILCCKVNDPGILVSCAFAAGAAAIITAAFGLFVLSSYHSSLALEGLRQDALTARQSVLKNRNYSKKGLTLEGNILAGSVKARYGEPAVRHRLEASAVKVIRKYNKRLGEMKGSKRGWLWLPSWGISSAVDSMKPIEVPEMR